MNIVVLDGYTLNPGDISWDSISALGSFTVHDRTSAEDVLEHARSADIILTNKCPLTHETLNQLSNLKYISVLATGFNIVDVQAARTRNIPVSNVPEYSTDSVAQHVFAFILNHCQHAQSHSDEITQNEAWTQANDFCFWNFPLIELKNKTIGILGYGRIGKRVAQLAEAFGMNILIHSRSYEQSVPFEELFTRSDFVTLHCPLTEANVECVNHELLKHANPNLLLINTARGGLIHEHDLADALNNGTIAGAALDVLSTEPPQSDNPLIKAKNCVITPHIAWATLAARKRLMQTTADNISAFQGGNPQNVVN